MSDPKPVCTTCGSAMTFVGIEPGNPGFELRIFKCLTCHRLQQYVVDGGGVLRTEGDRPRPMN